VSTPAYALVEDFLDVGEAASERDVVGVLHADR
jgi:hypothetical protein